MRHAYGKEKWTVISDFNIYEISTYGRVKNIKTGHIKKPREYGDVFLRKNGKLYRVNPTQIALRTFN